MRKHPSWLTTALVLMICCGPAIAQGPSEALNNWHQWRGPLANGTAPGGTPPIEFSATNNMQWRAALPGEGSSTPIVWGDRVFVTAAVPTERPAPAPPQPHPDAKTPSPENYWSFLVICWDRTTGALRWQREACQEVPHEGRHPTHTYAAASPTTDGERLYVSFGSRGIFCFSLNGEPLWSRDLGDMRTRYAWGEATSPVIHDGRLVINWDHEDDSFLAVLDANNGETLWQVDRPGEPTSWATPAIVEHDGRWQLIVHGTGRARGYDLHTGNVIWSCGGQTVNAIPSPLIYEDTAICMSGYRGSLAAAIPLDASGDITEAGERWTHERGTPYVPSPVLWQDRLFFTRTNSNILTVLNAATGAPLTVNHRLPAVQSFYASPTAADGRLYFVDREGTVIVLQADTLELLATNRLDDPIDASPVVVGNQLFLRSQQFLYCFRDDPS